MESNAAVWYLAGVASVILGATIGVKACGDPADKFRQRACWAELELAKSARDTLVVVMRDDFCKRWVYVEGPEGSQRGQR